MSIKKRVQAPIAVTASPVKLRPTQTYPMKMVRQEATAGVGMALLKAVAPVARAAAISAAQVAMVKFTLMLKEHLTGPEGEAMAVSLLANREPGTQLKFSTFVNKLSENPLVAAEFATLIQKLTRISKAAAPVENGATK